MAALTPAFDPPSLPIKEVCARLARDNRDEKGSPLDNSLKAGA